MIKLFFLIVLSLNTIFAASNIDKKIQTNTEKLNSSDDKKENTSLKIKELAEKIESQNSNITTLEKDINQINSELAKLDNIPEKSFVITFDDGFEDNYINAFPILQKFNFKATIYLVPNQKTNHWEKENTSVISNLLDEKQIIEMQNSGLIEFGSHTLSHVNLSKINDEQLFLELEKSKKEVENITKKECEAFAYPYGKFDDKIVESTKKVGYKNATVVKRGLFNKGDNIFTIKRIGILGTESFFDFLLKITRIRNKL